MKRPLRFSMSLSILFLSPMSAIVSAAVDIPLSLSSEKNYIVEVVLPGGSTSANIEDGRITAEGASQALATVVYYDGLGRPEQTARVGFTATGADLLSTVGYDEAGREYRQGLPTPVSGNNGCYVNPSTYGQTAQSYYGDTCLYRETLYENSPLSRTVGVKNPGSVWNAHPKTAAYRCNTAGEVVLFRISSDGVQRVGRYTPGALYVTRETDEDGIWQESFTDKSGRVVMTRQGNGYDTYYIYDDHGRLCYVLPPMAVDGMYNTGNYPDSHTLLQQYAYLYKYDDRGNCIGKRLPGCKSIQMIYDRANRLVMSQDGNQQSGSLWTITKYDALSRVLYTYETNPLRSPPDLYRYCRERRFVEERADSYNAWPGMGYTLRILLPAANDYRLLTVNYYDDYSFLYIEGTAASQLAYRSKEGYGAAYSSAKGLLTGTQVFDLTDRSKYAITVYYYDEYGNPVQTRTRHVSGDYEMTYAQCDLSGNILESYTEHLDSRGRLSVSESVENTYDRSGRLTRTDYTVNDSLSTDWRYEYDELGQISSKSIDGGLTHAKYRYNLQGWITRIEDVDFVQNLYYESLMGNYGKVRYNGNISAMNWTYRTDTDTIVNGYRFTYDAYDRLASAYSVTGSDFSSGRYHVEYEYDKHGNMVNLYRNGGRGGMIDEMNWSYEGNRVVEITDMVGEQGRYDMKEYRDYNHDGLDYFYDSNGNMTADLDRDIVAIRYNLLNLPDTVQFRNGSAIVNYYTADGKRTGSKYLTPLTTVVIPAGQTFGSTSGTAAMSSHVTARRGSLEYAGADFESDTLIRIHNGDGYLDCSEQDFRYFVRDYQGNIRTVYGSAVAKLTPVEPPFSLTNRGAIGGDKPPIRPTPIEHTVTYQRMQYYPFGLPYEAHYQPEEQPYKYGGKEFIELHGYDSYDFDARMYYPALCRFMTMDPLCEKYYSTSPYAYCNNNPVKYVDPDGESWRLTYDRIEGEVIFTGYEWVDEDKSYDVDGNLLQGLYAQAIFFSDNKTFDKDNGYNIGSSTATVYLADGTTETYAACTNPSGSDYATVPEGTYHAKVGMHKGAYTALRMEDTDGSGRIELGYENPAYTDGRTYAVGINIHKPGINNLTGMITKKRPISAGCLLVDINSWTRFIGHFEAEDQKNNTVSVTVSRSLSEPVNVNRLPAFNFILNGTRESFFSRIKNRKL